MSFLSRDVSYNKVLFFLFFLEMKKTPIHDKKTSIIQRVRDIQIGSVLNELNEVLRDYLNCLTEQRERSVKILRQMIEGEN